MIVLLCAQSMFWGSLTWWRHWTGCRSHATIFLLFGGIFPTLLHSLVVWNENISGKEPGCQCRRDKRHRFGPWVSKIPWRRAWKPTPVFLPGKSHGQRSLVDYSSWGCTLQNSCLENPMDRGAWRAIVHRVKNSQTWLKRLSTHLPY